VDYSRPQLHHLLDLGYDSTRELITQTLLSHSQASSSQPANPPHKMSPPRRKQTPRDPTSRSSVKRLRKALQNRSGESTPKKRKQPILGF
jgi:hypothetical protein